MLERRRGELHRAKEEQGREGIGIRGRWQVHRRESQGNQGKPGKLARWMHIPLSVCVCSLSLCLSLSLSLSLSLPLELSYRSCGFRLGTRTTA